MRVERRGTVHRQGHAHARLIASTNKTHLLETLARWILDRTQKTTAFASNFTFMPRGRRQPRDRIVRTHEHGDWRPFVYPRVGFSRHDHRATGYDAIRISIKPLRPERGYEVAGLLLGGFVLRASARAIAQQTPRMGFAVKALVAACGTAAMGRGLMAIYERDVDYSRLNDALANLASRAKGLASALTARGVRYEQPQDGGAVA